MIRLSEQKLQCPHCSSTGIPSNLRVHIKNKHGEAALEKFNNDLKSKKAQLKETRVSVCEICGHSCASVNGILSHYRTVHGQPPAPIQDPSSISLFTSSVSSVPSSEPSSKKFHLSTTDTSDLKILTSKLAKKQDNCSDHEKFRLKCVFEHCTFSSGLRCTLAEHIVSSHESDYIIEKEVFSSEDEFVKWLEQRQKETVTTFVKTKSDTSNKRTTVYYNCQHEGNYESKSKERSGHSSKKETGDKICPAFLKVSINEEKTVLKATGYFKHFGHKKNIALQKLSQEEVMIVRKLLEEGFVNKQVVQKLTEKYSPQDRLHFSTTEDVRNWRKKWRMYPGRRDDDDLKSLQIRMDEKNGEDGFRHYQEATTQLGENFQLVIITPQQADLLNKYHHRGIIIDDTHNVTRYHLKLSTILVLDGYDRGIPCGFLLSHSTTTEDVEILFRCVKNLCPRFTPAYVMSDEAYSFYNAFIKTFPNAPSKKSLCRWHVFRAWKKQAKSLLTEPLVKQILPKLRELIREPVVSQFNLRVTELFHFLTNVPNGQKFIDYFRSRYLGRIGEWSTTAREGIHCHTSMYAESWHSMLKKELLDGNKNIRVDTLVHMLLVGFTWVIEKNNTQIKRGLARGIPRLTMNRQFCRKAKESLREYVIMECEPEFSEEKEYRVKKIDSEDLEGYRVVEKPECLCFQDENCHCPCGACGYRFRCTCLLQKAGIACKHVHMILLYLEKCKRNEFLEPNPLLIDDDFDQPIIRSDSHLAPNRPSCSTAPRSATDAQISSTLATPASQSSSCHYIDDAEKDNALKLYDTLVGATSEYQSHIRSLIKSNPTDAVKSMEEVIKAIASHLPSKQPALPIRTNLSSQSARDTMNRHLPLAPRRLTRPTDPSTSSSPLVPRDVVSVCGLCFLADPPLPHDAHPEEEESRVTLWRRCPECSLAVHLTCSLSEKVCEPCGVRFEDYN